MALKVLQQGYVPLGQFDFKDSSTVLGGECARLSEQTASASSGKYAKDVSQWIDDGSSELPMFELGGPFAVGASTTYGATSVAGQTILSARSTAGYGYVTLFGLTDDGTSGYGTLFGELIGARVGQATSVSGATVIGPATHLATGKVTIWTQAGLYGVAGTPAQFIDNGACLPNELLYGLEDAENNPGYLVSEADDSANGDVYGAGGGVAIFVGLMSDSSLVRTSTQLATGSQVGAASEEYAAVYLLGPSAPGSLFPAFSAS